MHVNQILHLARPRTVPATQTRVSRTRRSRSIGRSLSSASYLLWGLVLVAGIVSSKESGSMRGTNHLATGSVAVFTKGWLAHEESIAVLVNNGMRRCMQPIR